MIASSPQTVRYRRTLPHLQRAAGREACRADGKAAADGEQAARLRKSYPSLRRQEGCVTSAGTVRASAEASEAMRKKDSHRPSSTNGSTVLHTRGSTACTRAVARVRASDLMRVLFEDDHRLYEDLGSLDVLLDQAEGALTTQHLAR